MVLLLIHKLLVGGETIVALLVSTPLINFFFFSTMTSWTKDGEVDAYRNMLEKVHAVNDISVCFRNIGGGVGEIIDMHLLNFSLSLSLCLSLPLSLCLCLSDSLCLSLSMSLCFSLSLSVSLMLCLSVSLFVSLFLVS